MTNCFCRKFGITQSADRDDVSQECWLSILSAIPRFDATKGDIYAFLATCVRRRFAKWHHYKRTLCTSYEDRYEPQPQRCPLPLDLPAVERSEELPYSMIDFVRCIPKLPQREDRALLVHLLAGERVRTCADKLGMTRQAMYLRRVNVQRRLKQLLNIDSL